ALSLGDSNPCFRRERAKFGFCAHQLIDIVTSPDLAARRRANSRDPRLDALLDLWPRSLQGVKPLASKNPRIENPVAGGDARRGVLRHFRLRLGEVPRGAHGLFIVHPLASECIDES